jgi:hypothetical protein
LCAPAQGSRGAEVTVSNPGTSFQQEVALPFLPNARLKFEHHGSGES